MNTALISRYTDAVLSFEFKNPTPPYHVETLSDDDIKTFVTRTLKFLTKSGADNLVLFGLGSGTVASALASALPADKALIVCETNTTNIRTFLENNSEWNNESDKAIVLADTSSWAQFYLLNMAGASSENTHTVLNPELPTGEKEQLRSLQKLFVSARSHQAINSAYLSHVAVQAPDLSVGVILDPNEPDLETFFAQFPDWIKEVVVIWDNETIPEVNYECAAPIKNIASPLTDFSSQRNKMVKECSGEWILYLDGDELFSEDTWSLFTALLLIKRLEACYFPRMTFYPDENNCKVGFGLWPDLQLRLFRNRESVRFENPIHEKLTGVEGRVALALDAPILHYSRLRKTPETLTAKLKRFDTVGNKHVQHLLNEDYPNLSRSAFSEASFIAGALQVMLLEENPA